MPPCLNKLVLNISYTLSKRLFPDETVCVCVCHAEAATSVAADGERVEWCVRVSGLFDDRAFPLEPASVAFLPDWPQFTFTPS